MMVGVRRRIGDLVSRITPFAEKKILQDGD
jgi:hypothetical protein